MARSKSYKRKNVHNFKKSRQYKHLGGNTCHLKITAKKNIDIILPEDFKKKDFFEIEYNQKLYRIVWDISWFDKQLNKGTYSFLIYTAATNNNFNIETHEKIKSIDALIDKMKIIFEKNTINCLTKMFSILSQSKDDVFKDNVFTHLRNKLQLVIANSRTTNFDNNKKRRDNLIIYRNQLFVCKIRKEYPDIYNKLITTYLKDLTIFNNLNTDLDLSLYNTSIGSLAARIKECNAAPSTTNSQAKLIEDLQKQILELKTQQSGIGNAGDKTFRNDGFSGNDACKPKEIEIYKNIYTDIYNQIRTILYTLGSSTKESLKKGTSGDNLDILKQNNIDNFLTLNDAINVRIKDSIANSTTGPSSEMLKDLTKYKEKELYWSELKQYLVNVFNLNKELIELDISTIAGNALKLKELTDKINRIKYAYEELKKRDINKTLKLI